jgi:hypothetical protein
MVQVVELCLAVAEFLAGEISTMRRAVYGQKLTFCMFITKRES